jgi:hypothetical protein
MESGDISATKKMAVQMSSSAKNKIYRSNKNQKVNNLKDTIKA